MTAFSTSSPLSSHRRAIWRGKKPQPSPARKSSTLLAKSSTRICVFAQLPATLSAHVLEKATGGRGLLIVMAMALAALSCWGILYLPLDWALWMAILFGLATGTVFSRGMALMVERARTPSESIRLSGMSQGIGFTMGALLSLLFTSFLHQGGSFLPFCLVYTFFCVLGMVSGRMSARPGYV